MAVDSWATRNPFFEDGLHAWYALRGGDDTCRLVMSESASREKAWHGMAQDIPSQLGVQRVTADVSVRDSGGSTAAAAVAGGGVGGRGAGREVGEELGREAVRVLVTVRWDFDEAYIEDPPPIPSPHPFRPSSSNRIRAPLSPLFPSSPPPGNSLHRGSPFHPPICTAPHHVTPHLHPIHILFPRSSHHRPHQVTAYIEGPPPNFDLLISLFAIVPASDPQPTFPPLPPATPAAMNFPPPLTPLSIAPTLTPLAPFAAPKVSAAATVPPCPTSPPLHPPHHSPRPNLLLNGDFSLRTASWRPMGGCEVLTWHAPCPWGSVIGPPVEPSSLPAAHPCTVFERQQMQLHAQWQQQQQQKQLKKQHSYPVQLQHDHMASSHPVMPLLQSASSVFLAGGPTGAYVEVTGRTATWHGPAQDIAVGNHSHGSSTAAAAAAQNDGGADGGPIRLFVTYAVSAWVRLGRDRQHKERGQGEQKILSLFARKEKRGEEGGAEETEEKEAEGTEGRVGSHQVNIALGVDGGWVNAGTVEASGKEWVRCWGSFRLEKPYGQAVLYVQGPPPGVSILLADMRVVPVEWRERVPWLREQADRVSGGERWRVIERGGERPLPLPHPLRPFPPTPPLPVPHSLSFSYTPSLSDMPTCPLLPPQTFAPPHTHPSFPHQLRKGSLRLRLLSAAGQPIPCAHVSANQTRRAFPLGTCVNARDLLGNPRYQSYFLPQREGSRTGAQTPCSGHALQLSPEGKGSRSSGAWFSWGVCENELKWTSVEARRGEEDWRDADAMVAWMQEHGVAMRAHCLFWDNMRPPWVDGLSLKDLKGDPTILALCIKEAVDNRVMSFLTHYPTCFSHMDVNNEMLHGGFFSSRCAQANLLPYLPYPTPPPYTEAIDSRITSFLTRYPNCFAHMDVNNEMLHGGFFSSRCGPSIIPRMFQFAAQIAPPLVLFLNEYHIEDGEDEKSRPEKYAQFARELIASGAPVGGLGTQCHISAPVGAHMRHAWSIMADVGLPVWVTELDVSSIVEKVRADDLEICLREAFGHGGVEGVVLWGFWEGSGPDRPSMSRKNAHLVRSDWSLTEAGEMERLLEEWTSRGVVGRTDEEGWFVVEGFAGEYEVVVRDGGKEWRTIVEPSTRTLPLPRPAPPLTPHIPGPTPHTPRRPFLPSLPAPISYDYSSASRLPHRPHQRAPRDLLVPRTPPPPFLPTLISLHNPPPPPFPPLLPHPPSPPDPPSTRTSGAPSPTTPRSFLPLHSPPVTPPSPHVPHQSALWDLHPLTPSLISFPPLPAIAPSLLAGFPISPINPHLGISASGSVPPGAALLLCDDVAAEGSFLLLHLLKSHLLSPPLQGGGAGERRGEEQGEGGCAGGGEGCVRTVCLVALAHPPSHYSHIARRMGVHFTDLCRQHRLAIIDGQSQAYTWQPDGLDHPRVCLQQEKQKEMPHQDQQQKEMPLQQQQQQQAGVYRFSPPVPFSPPPHPPSQTLPINGYPPHSANASPLRGLYSSICAAVTSLGCPHSSQPAHTPSHPSQPPSHPTEPLSQTAPPATTQPAADDAAGSGAGAATSPSPSGAADVAPPARCGGQLCIVIDDVSLLETCAGGDSRLVMDFLSACRGLCTKHHRASVVFLTHSAVHPTNFTFAATPPPPLRTLSSSSSSPIASPPFLPWLLHLSDVLVLLRPLTSGHASDVHGQADIVHLTPMLLNSPSHGNDSHPTPCQQQHLVYQIADTGALFSATQ
ncbi:unnamed protein product [Closterium sp. Naga37s-1]|nr:unnamed protein product [Closterium sp. Naga37s-1]